MILFSGLTRRSREAVLRFHRVISVITAVVCVGLLAAPAAQASYNDGVASCNSFNSYNPTGNWMPRAEVETWLAFGEDDTFRQPMDNQGRCRRLDMYGDHVKIRMSWDALRYIVKVKGKPAPKVTSSLGIATIVSDTQILTGTSSSITAEGTVTLSPHVQSLAAKAGFKYSQTTKLSAGHRTFKIYVPCKVGSTKDNKRWFIQCHQEVTNGDVTFHWPAGRVSGGLQSVENDYVFKASYNGHTYTIPIASTVVQSVACGYLDSYQYGCPLHW